MGRFQVPDAGCKRFPCRMEDAKVNDPWHEEIDGDPHETLDPYEPFRPQA